MYYIRYTIYINILYILYILYTIYEIYTILYYTVTIHDILYLFLVAKSENGGLRRDVVA